MSRKHFEAIAELLAEFNLDTRFDRELFLKASGLRPDQMIHPDA